MNHTASTALLGLVALAAVQPAAAQKADGPTGPLTADQIAAMVLEQTAVAVNSRDIPPGYRLMGDMQVPISFNPYQDGFFVTNTWNGPVPYVFAAGHFTVPQQNAIIAAMQVWQNLSGATFIPRSVQADYVVIQLSTGNNSAVGRQGGVQIINFAAGQSQRVYVHELGHCLGFLHEHQRPDRTNFISIRPCNVQGVTCNGFGQVLTTGAIYDNNFPPINNQTNWASYDFASIMHYDRCAFSTACPAGATCVCNIAQETMHVVEPYTAAWNDLIGNAASPSTLDGVTARGLYPYGGDRWLDPAWFGGQNGSFTLPWNTSFGAAADATPVGGTLLVKRGAHFPAVRTFNRALTILAPNGTVELGS